MPEIPREDTVAIAYRTVHAHGDIRCSTSDIRCAIKSPLLPDSVHGVEVSIAPNPAAAFSAVHAQTTNSGRLRIGGPFPPGFSAEVAPAMVGLQGATAPVRGSRSGCLAASWGFPIPAPEHHSDAAKLVMVQSLTTG